MGLGWQQGPLGATLGRFLTAQPLPERLLFAEPLRRRMRVRLAGQWIADSENVVLLHEPGRYPVAYFPTDSVRETVLALEASGTKHRELGDTVWFSVCVQDQTIPRAAWQHVNLPGHADMLQNHVAFDWQAMDSFYEEDERIVGHAADPYHRIDIRQSSRHLVVRSKGHIVANCHRPLVLFESGYAPRWFVPRDDIDEPALSLVDKRTLCPYKGIASYYDIGGAKQAAWSYREAWQEVARISDFVSFEPEKVDVFIDGRQLRHAASQAVPLYGSDRRLDLEELRVRAENASGGK
jgi:uncharacterized protein (DUF427 family)